MPAEPPKNDETSDVKLLGDFRLMQKRSVERETMMIGYMYAVLDYQQAGR